MPGRHATSRPLSSHRGPRPRSGNGSPGAPRGGPRSRQGQHCPRGASWRTSVAARSSTADSMGALARELRYADVSALYTAVGEGPHLGAARGAAADRSTRWRRGMPRTRSPSGRRRRTSGAPNAVTDVGVSVPGAPGTLTKLAKCCTPVPGDAIMGSSPAAAGQRAPHRLHQRVLTQQQAERIIEVKWGAVAVVGVPGGHPGRGARPAPVALRCRPGARRRKVNIPVGAGDHLG